jgi:hypothetical protein
MEFKNTLEIVTKDIQDIEKLVGNFKNYSRIPNIELDLALSRLRNVYDLLLLFRADSIKDSYNPVLKTDAEVLASDPEGKLVNTPDPASVKTEEPVIIAPPAKETTGATSVIITPPEVIPVIETKETVSQGHDPAHKQNIKKKPEEQKIFIHEKLGEHIHKKDITTKMQNQAIISISGSLGINDKFLFIRELFGGNAEIFRQTLEELDDALNFNDAYSQLIGKFHWDMDSEPVQMLLNLIRRKFITSGNE